MNKTSIYHVSLSSHDEVMFRDQADFRMGFNCLAVAAIATESRLLADGFMSTHYHALIQTSSLKELMRRARYAYSRYFNNKYTRTGKLAEEKYFSLEIAGLNHTIAAINYVIRQGLHHGLTTTPFGYPYCSANTYYRQELGKTETPELLQAKHRCKYLPSNIKIPQEYRMSADGQLLREDVIDVTWVEQVYVSPKSFLFHMNRIANERDIQEQKEENQLPPVTLDTIEKGVPGFNLQEAKTFERERGVRNAMTDLELCAYIDTDLLPRLLKPQPNPSIYMLPEERRSDIANWLWSKSRNELYKKGSNSPFSSKTITEPQLRRCLALK